MKYTFKQVRDSLTPQKRRNASLWVRLWARRTGEFFAWICLNCGVTANQASVGAILLCVVALFFMCFNNWVMALIGLILACLFIAVDCTDGVIARTSKSNSFMGEYYDALGGYTMASLSMFGAGMVAYHFASWWPESSRYWLIFIGAFGGMADIFSRLVYHKFTVNEIFANSQRGITELSRENDEVDRDHPTKNIFLYLRIMVDQEFGIAGFYPPILLVTFLLGVPEIGVCGYALYHTVGLIAVMYVFLRKATVYDIKAKQEQNETK